MTAEPPPVPPPSRPPTGVGVALEAFEGVGMAGAIDVLCFLLLATVHDSAVVRSLPFPWTLGLAQAALALPLAWWLGRCDSRARAVSLAACSVLTLFVCGWIWFEVFREPQ